MDGIVDCSVRRSTRSSHSGTRDLMPIGIAKLENVSVVVAIAVDVVVAVVFAVAVVVAVAAVVVIAIVVSFAGRCWIQRF